jgi:RNA polymerase subunit RPABC4/transcription elongation factor Spt4
MDVNIKSCSKCNAEYEAQVSKCPECDSEFFILVSPQDSSDSSIVSRAGRVPYVRPKSKFEIEEEKRLEHEESMDPELLAKFKHRFKLELEEISYLEWRALQPEWQHQVMKANSDPKSQAVLSGLVSPRAVGTAAGVFIGTTIIGTESNGNDQGGESIDSSGAEEGGIIGLLGDLFS